MEVTTAIGIDVGGPRKGYHAVALRGTTYVDRTESKAPDEIADWCKKLNASVVAVDAPCKWSLDGRARSAERELTSAQIFCFATPSKATGELKRFYRWMLNGAALYAALEPEFPLFDGKHRLARMCIETFPHAVACSLAGQVLKAKSKKQVRGQLLKAAGLDISKLPNIDYVDAGMCALTALYVREDRYKLYGTKSDGFIVVPHLVSS